MDDNTLHFVYKYINNKLELNQGNQKQKTTTVHYFKSARFSSGNMRFIVTSQW